MRIHNAGFFRKCFLYGDIGFGEAYVDGDWDTPDLTDVIRWMILNVENNAVMSGSRRSFTTVNLLKFVNRFFHLARRNSRTGSSRNIVAHYDLSNEFFGEFLDPSMVYSSAYFETENTELEAAQREKMDRLCRKLRLDSCHHVLEIGCGWGSFAIHAAQNYGCRVTGITISPQQYELARQRVAEAGVSDLVEIRLQDYRLVTGQYDRIVSIEMLEAVGDEFLPVFFAKCHEVLKKSGVLGLQVITSPDSRYETFKQNVDWIQKHIFPGSLLPSIGAVNHAIQKTGDLVLRNLEDFGTHYARTLALWRDQFEKRIDRIRTLGFDETFRRKWNYYLSYCEAAFRMRNISVVQIVYSRPNNTLY
jgi:cyclopropane-fatty-acyl-phospholipid synthase